MKELVSKQRVEELMEKLCTLTHFTLMDYDKMGVKRTDPESRYQEGVLEGIYKLYSAIMGLPAEKAEDPEPNCILDD